MKRTRAAASKLKSMDGSTSRLSKEFFAKPSVELAKALLGKVFVKKLTTGEIIKGIIVETEAYRMDDAASHAYNGRRGKKNEATYMGPGHTNVYFTYGMYHCMNISAGEDGSACLIRGIEPIEGILSLRAHREQARKKPKMTDELNKKPAKELENWEIANGPGKLCIAFDLSTAKSDRINLTVSDTMWLEKSLDERFREGAFEVEIATRIGIDSTPDVARNQLWRFYIKDNFAVSTMKPGAIKKIIKSKELEESAKNEAV